MRELRGDLMENTVSQSSSQTEEKIVFKKQSQAKEVWRMYKKNKGAMIGLVLFSFILVMLAGANFIVPYSAATKGVFSQINQPPSAEHIFGTDSYGRDVFARVLYGGRTSLLVALLATMSSCLIGSTLGAISGYFGGKVDSIIMRSLDIFMSIPDILFTMAVVFALGANFQNLLIALTLAYFTNYVRLVRS